MILALHQIFKLLIAVKLYPVPKLGRTRVQIVYGVQIHVFLVPAEERSPRSHVQIRRSHTWNGLVTHSFVQKSVKFSQIPGNSLIKEGVHLVGTINWRVISKWFPIESLNLVVTCASHWPLSRLFLHFVKRSCRFHPILELIKALTSVDVLFNWRFDLGLVLAIWALSRFPPFRRSNLKHANVWRNELLCLLNEFREG